MTGILALLTLLIVLFGGGGGGQNARQNKQPPKTQPQSEQKDSANLPPANSSEPKNAVSVPTPALPPGLIGLGAAALRKRKSAIVTPED